VLFGEIFLPGMQPEEAGIEFAGVEQCRMCHGGTENGPADPVYSFGHIERTYSEWVLSDYAKQGAEGACQSCHYPSVEGGGQASRYGKLHRDHFVYHGPVGGSTWVQDAVVDLWPTTDVNKKALQHLDKNRQAPSDNNRPN